MKNSKIVLVVVNVITLVILFIASCTNMLLKEDNEKIYNVVVLMDHEKKQSIDHYMKGMNAATRHWKVQLSVINQYSQDYITNYIKQVAFDEDVKIDAMVVYPKEGIDMISLIEQQKLTIPIIIVEQNIRNSKVVYMGADQYRMGQDLAKAILEDQLGDESMSKVYLIGAHTTTNQEYKRGVLSILKNHQIMYEEREYNQQSDINALYRELMQKNEKAVIISLSTEGTEGVVDAFGQRLEEDYYLYGNGSSSKIVHFMELGYVKAITAQNEYDIGYLGIEQIVNYYEKSIKPIEIIREHHLIRYYEVNKKENESVLFPIS